MEHVYAPREKNMKPLQVSELNEGDKIKLITGEVMTFVRLKRTKFVATMNGKDYSVPVSMFDSVIEKVDLNSFQEFEQNREKEKKNILSELKKGDYFYINKNNNAIVFKFECVEGRRIIGINPINGNRSRIDMAFEIGKLV